MLKRLSISNIALVDEATIEFGRGLSVITGETGAGKSVLVNSIALLLGERADREYVRNGAESASVVGEFDVHSLGKTYLDTVSDLLDNGILTIERDISIDGRSRVRIGGRNTTVAGLKQITEPIAEILGQHANQRLMNEDNHLAFLDHFGSLVEARVSVSEKYGHWQVVAGELRRTVKRREELDAERELLLFQKTEIEKADIRPGEEAELLNEKRVLDSSRSLMEAAASIVEALDGESSSALEAFRHARKEFDRMASIDRKLATRSEELEAIDFQIEDFRQFVEQYGESLEDNPARLEEINARLEELYNLKKKYGGSEAAILDRLSEIDCKLKDRPDTARLISDLTEKEQKLRAGYSREAIALSESRHHAAKYLSKLVEKELRELAIDNGGFEFAFEYEDDADGIEFEGVPVKAFAHGIDNGRFLFSANPGEPLRSLVKTASGGEISRVLLAIKSAEKKSQKRLHPVMVLDEIDAGIGGETAVEVGRKLAKLSEDRQVLTITHLHQIARQASHHIAVHKATDSDGRSVIRVTSLDDKGIQQELERMLALPE